MVTHDADLARQVTHAITLSDGKVVDEDDGRRIQPGRAHGHRATSAIALPPHRDGSSIRGISSDPGAPDGTAPLKRRPTRTATPTSSPEQIYEEVMARLAAITDQWQQARDALLGG
jgi:hypothetical protein